MSPARIAAALLAVLILASPAGPAPPVPPDRIGYQGVLFDSGGAPRTGSVDLTLRIYDAASGGTLLYKQSFRGVPLHDGVFSVEIGPSGEASDAPDDPLTTALSAALTGDLGATGPARFLDVVVGAEGSISRTQILTVPYALHAASADSAAVAESALTAQSATNATGVGGLDSSFVTQLYLHGNDDSSGPSNSDPREGLDDLDSDGRANFIDGDNDGDGIADGTEFNRGSDMNLVTPSITRFFPASADGFLTSTVTVEGVHFEPGIGVEFGTQTPAARNVTATSFQVDVGPQAEGSALVRVTKPNGQSSTASFPFTLVTPVIQDFEPDAAFVGTSARILVTGQHFHPATTVRFGSQSPVPENVTPTSLEIEVGPEPTGAVTVVVTHPNGKSDTAPPPTFEFGNQASHGVPVAQDTQLSLALHGAGIVLVGGQASYRVLPGPLMPLATQFHFDSPNPGQIAVSFDPSGALSGVRCRALPAFDCAIELLSDSDADLELEDEVGTLIETLPGPSARLLSASLAFDAVGRPALGYLARRGAATVVVVAYDRDGDGSFGGPGERVDVAPSSAFVPDVGRLAFDGSGGLAYAYLRWDGATPRVEVAYDHDADGSFTRILAGSLNATCVGVAFDPADRLAVIHSRKFQVGTVSRDLNDDLDFADPGEQTMLAGSHGCDLVTPPGGPLTGVANLSGVKLLRDRNDDGDFADASEQTPVESVNDPVFDLAVDGAGQRWLATQDEVTNLDVSP